MNWTKEQRYRPLNSESQAEYEALCEQAKNGKWRQKFHIQPPAGLLNDPNGFCWHDGRFHLFYQWFPLGAIHGLKYWHHLTSKNLVDFQSLGIGIAPDTIEDSHGAYSGSALSQGKNLLIAYTGNHRTAHWERIPYQRTAILTDGVLTKNPPFLSGAPKGYTEHTRDPKIWQESDGAFGMVLGAQRENKTGTVLYLKNIDGLNWDLKGEINLGDLNAGYMVECPDYFSLKNNGHQTNAKHETECPDYFSLKNNGHQTNNQYEYLFNENKSEALDVLFFCPQGLDNYPNIFQCGYVMGHFDKSALTFKHSGFQELDYGFEYYAVQTCLTENNERIAIGWFGLPDMSCPSASEGWAHCLTLPRMISLENGQLYQRPIPALEALRTNEHNGVHYELILNNPDNEPFEFNLRVNDKERTVLTYNGSALIFNRLESGLLPEPEIEVAPNKCTHIRELSIKNIHKIQLFSDTSSLEIFINDGQYVMSGRIYPQSLANGIKYEIAPSASLQIYGLKETL